MRSLKNYVMNGKVFLTKKGFGETCEYVCQRQEYSKVLAVEGVRGHDPDLMAEDFEWQHRLMPEKEHPVFHSVLSFPPGETVADERLVEIGRKYMQKIGMADTQYAFVKHTDKEHLHVHIVANRVDNDGKPTGKGLIVERSIKAARELTQEYGLRPENGKQLGQTHLEALHEPDVKRYRIYQAIREELPKCRNLDELEARLKEKEISVRYRLDEKTSQRVGISFRLENRSFKGSLVDTAYALKGLERTLVLQQRQEQEEKLRLAQQEKLRQVPEEVLRQAQGDVLRRALREKLGMVQEEEVRLVQRRGLRLGM